jgi:hypothetical protein
MSPSGKESRGPSRSLRRVSLILAAAGLTTASCQLVQQDVDIAPPRLRIRFQVSSTPPPGVNLYRFRWTGSWNETGGVTGDGAEDASGWLDLPPTAVAEEAFLVKFADSPALHPGWWEISAAVTKNGTTSSGICILEIFSGLPTVVTFTEGLPDCAAQMGGS